MSGNARELSRHSAGRAGFSYAARLALRRPAHKLACNVRAAPGDAQRPGIFSMINRSFSVSLCTYSHGQILTRGEYCSLSREDSFPFLFGQRNPRFKHHAAADYCFNSVHGQIFLFVSLSAGRAGRQRCTVVNPLSIYKVPCIIWTLRNVDKLLTAHRSD